MSVPFVCAALSRQDGSEADGVHLLWTAPYAAGYSVEGYDIQRRISRYDPRVTCYALSQQELRTLHQDLRLDLPVARVALSQADCPLPPADLPDEPYKPDKDAAHPLDHEPGLARAGHYLAKAETGTPTTPSKKPAFRSLAPQAGSVRAATAGLLAPSARAQPVCLAYRIALFRPHEYVQVIAGVPGMLAIALRDCKAVASELITEPTGTQEVIIKRRSVDQVILYVARAISSLTVCVDTRPESKDEAAEWRDVPFIARGIQLPLHTVNGSVASAAGEDALAASRLLPGEPFDGAAFREVAEVMNELARQAKIASPMWYSTLTRGRVEDPFIDLRGWPLSLSLLADTSWRRMLGFGYLDPDGKVVPGEAYDYRITGYFRRRDVEEVLYGFHTVPLGTTLPAWFHLGPVRWNTFRPSQVELFPPVPGPVLRAAGRKGIALRPAGPGGQSLSLTFPTAVTSVTLELEPASAHNLRYEARTSDYLLGLAGSLFADPVPPEPRVTLEFADPVDTLNLFGEALLYGVRMSTFPPGTDPDELVEQSVVVYWVCYEPTLEPAPPPFLGTVNLQEPIVAGDPALTVQSPPRPLGFRLYWLPPPSGSTGPLPWPPDLAAFPPFDVLGFHLERRRVDTGEAFQPVGEERPATLFFGDRGSCEDPPPLYPGIDLLGVFPEVSQPVPPVSLLMHVDDVLLSAAKDGPPPGSLHQYRIFSVDAIARRSATATVGSVVRLEKRIPPPQPVGPTTAPPAGSVMPVGVRARVLHGSDPHLTADDKLLLGASTNAIVLEWGWGQQERAKDPFAVEFRLYWQPVPPDRVEGSLVGSATLVGSEFQMTASLNQPIAADAMRGRYIMAGRYPFKVASHPPGQVVTVHLEPSAVDPSAVPGEGTFVFHPVLRGDELRPSAWPERVDVVPITATEDYQYILRDRLTLDAAHPAARVWVGVSAADKQGYVSDELPAFQPNGGRPGNESSIAAATAQARYIGRPVFMVPPPLPDVPEQVTDEPARGSVPVTLDLAVLLAGVPIPGGHGLLLERLSGNDLVNLIQARDDDQIGVRLPGGASDSYTLANPGDQSAFLAQIRTGTPGRIEGRFLMDLLIRYRTQITALWQPALPGALPFGPMTDTLPDKAERYFYRVRLVDPARHVSEDGALVPEIVRVPSLRVPAPPEIKVLPSADDTLQVSARVHNEFDLAWLILFALIDDLDEPPDERTLEKAQLLRLPNRRDLYPDDGIRLRLADGSLLAPTTTALVAGGALEAPDRLLTLTLTPGFDKRVAVWATSMTRDGISSRFSGPRAATTGPAPLVVPALTVATGAGLDRATWQAPPARSELALERSHDGGATWARVSPWLPETATGYDVPAPPGPCHYRLAVRGRQGRSAVGPAATPA